MTDPLVPNFTPGAGRLSTDRYDFQKHVDGYTFRHHADQINLSPTIVINGDIQSTLQQFAEAISDGYFTPPVIADATASVKGIIKLTKDLSGTAALPIVAGLQGRPISNSTPISGDILTWNGSTWTPQTNTSSFTAGGDLGGTNTLQQVIGLTGVSNIINVNGNIIDWISGKIPLITQINNTSTHGTDFTIRAQSSNITNRNGGDLILAGGTNGNGGLRGGVKLQLTNNVAGSYPNSMSGITASNMIEVTEVAANRRVISLCNPNDITTTQMPANTGDMVIHIKDAVVNPTASPTNGFILYSNSGNPFIYTAGGTKFGITGTSGSAGSIVGYLTVEINGVARKIPYYATA